MAVRRSGVVLGNAGELGRESASIVLSKHAEESMLGVSDWNGRTRKICNKEMREDPRGFLWTQNSSKPVIY